MIWQDLSDGELRRRIHQRGVPLGTTNVLVRCRESEWAAERISKLLR